MAFIQLSDLITTVRTRTNTEASQAVTDTEITSYLNSSIADLYDIMVESDQYYFTNNTQIYTLNAGQDMYPLPTGSFYQLQGVDWQQSSGSDWYPVHKFNWSERDNFTGWNFFGPTTTYTVTFKYAQFGDSIVLRPIPNGIGGQLRIWYTNVYVDLVNPTDSFNFFNHWEEYVINDTCAKIADKLERDMSFFERQRAKVEDRIRKVIDGRDSSEPSCAVNPDRGRPKGFIF